MDAVHNNLLTQTPIHNYNTGTNITQHTRT